MAQWNVAYWDEDKIVSVTASGVMNLAQIRDVSAAAIAKAAEHGATKYFVDYREMVPDLATVDIYDLPPALERLGLQKTDKLALGYSQSSPRREDFEFFETVAQNHGYGVRLFSEAGKAIDWLKSK